MERILILERNGPISEGLFNKLKDYDILMACVNNLAMALKMLRRGDVTMLIVDAADYGRAAMEVVNEIKELCKVKIAVTDDNDTIGFQEYSASGFTTTYVNKPSLIHELVKAITKIL